MFEIFGLFGSMIHPDGFATKRDTSWLATKKLTHLGSAFFHAAPLEWMLLEAQDCQKARVKTMNHRWLQVVFLATPRKRKTPRNNEGSRRKPSTLKILSLKTSTPQTWRGNSSKG